MVKLKSPFRKRLWGAWAGELLGLYFLQGLNYLFPLLLMAHLSRTLSREAFALFALGQTLALYLQWLVDYGFSLTATREVAQNRNRPQHLGGVWTEVVVARSLLLLPATLLAALSTLHPLLRENPGIALGALLYPLALAISPSWFLRGLGRAVWAGMLESASRLVSLLGILLLVRTPGAAAEALAIGGTSALLFQLGGAFWVWKRLPKVRLPWGAAWGRLRAGSRILSFHLVTGLSAVLGPWALGLYAPAKEVALLGAAERLVRALWGALEPLSQTLFPRLVATPSGERGKVWRKGGGALLGLALLLALAVVSFAPLLVALLLGEGYGEAVPLVRLLALLLPLGAATNLLAVHRGLGSGRDRDVNCTFFLWMPILLGTNLAGACWGGALGVVLGNLLAHGFLLVLLWGFLRKG